MKKIIFVGMFVLAVVVSAKDYVAEDKNRAEEIHYSVSIEKEQVVFVEERVSTKNPFKKVLTGVLKDKSIVFTKMSIDGIEKAIKPVVSSFEVENDTVLIDKFKYVAVEIVPTDKTQYVEAKKK